MFLTVYEHTLKITKIGCYNWREKIKRAYKNAGFLPHLND